MGHYRKLPVVIQAYQIGSDEGFPDDIWNGVNDRTITLYLDRDPFGNTIGHVEIETLEGTMRGNVGDWIIKGVNGEYYPCKPDVFAKTYKAVGDSMATASGDENAKRIYDGFPYHGPGEKPAWVEGGNSYMQDEARRQADLPSGVNGGEE